MKRAVDIIHRDGPEKAIEATLKDTIRLAERLRKHVQGDESIYRYINIDLGQAATLLEDCDILLKVIRRDFNLVRKT